ncbi:hypothetical protein [Levilactobacillus huananensis]|uniref:hypothetical protein n=1 Tax=Levilactobacillus huananensis TaxID=2486019 RepID=UPI000F7A4CBB|nr:hypothetical protein [Levilactobacillus huananensis]
MKKMNRILVTAIMIATMVFGTVLPSKMASAATKTGYSRINKWTHGFNHDKYRVKNANGKTYKMTGTKKNVKLKTNHYLKNYKKTTWVRIGVTQIKHKGNWMYYYYMKPITKKKRAGGWVKLTDMKPVKTYKADKHHTADFDTWYRTLNQTQRNEYVGFVEQGGASDGDGEPSQIPKEYLN